MVFPVITGVAKRLGEREKYLSSRGGWTCLNEVLGWILDIEAGTVTLPDRKLEELLNLVDFPATQRRTYQKDLELLVG